jgi:hypothetical protein
MPHAPRKRINGEFYLTVLMNRYSCSLLFDFKNAPCPTKMDKWGILKLIVAAYSAISDSHKVSMKKVEL